MHDRLRVLVLDQGFGLWGAQRYLLRLAPLLAEEGITMVLASPPELELHREWTDAGLEAHACAFPISRNIRGRRHRPHLAHLVREATRVPTSARRVAELATRTGADVLWANSHWLHLDTALAGRLAGLPSVLHLHEESLPGIGTTMRAAAVRLADRAIAVSHQVSQGLPQSVFDRVSVIGNGVDIHEYSPAENQSALATVNETRTALGVSPDETLVLAATRLDPSKRIEDLITAVAAQDTANVRLVIAGDTSEYPEYRDEVIEGALRRGKGRVQFLGRRRDMVNLLRAADLFLHAGLKEGMPLGIIEAQSCGTPVVAYAAAGVSEVVVDRVTGLLVEPGDVNGLSVALREILTAESLQTSMSKHARTRAVLICDVRQQAAANAELLRAVSTRSRPQAAT